MRLVLHQQVAARGAEMQLDVGYFFHRHGVAAIGIRRDQVARTVEIQSVTNSDPFLRKRFVYPVFWRRDGAATNIQHIEVPATQSFPTSKIVERVPGNRVASVGKGSCVDVKEAHSSATVCVAWK